MMLTDLQKRQLAAIADQYECECIVAFGSKARDEYREDSDLDIAVLTKRTPDYDLFGKLFHALSEIFPNEMVDVRFLNDADPLFSIRVAQDGILLAGNQDVYDEFRMLANKRYIDDGRKYFPFLDILLEEQQKTLQQNL